MILYRLKKPPDCPLSRCSRIVACISSSTARNSLSSGSKSTSRVPGFGDRPKPMKKQKRINFQTTRQKHSKHYTNQLSFVIEQCLSEFYV